jgi:beta-lactamase class A
MTANPIDTSRPRRAARGANRALDASAARAATPAKPAAAPPTSATLATPATLALCGLLLLAAGCGGGQQNQLRAPWEAPRTAQSQAIEKALDKALRHVRERVAVAYLDLGDHGRVLRDESRHYHAASTMKLAVMITAWAAIDAGDLKLDQPIPVRNEFRSIVDGTRYQLAPADDADPELYKAVGSTRPLAELIRRMIVRSSNLATNILVDRLTPARITEAARSMGAYDIEVLRGVEDEKAYQAGFNNEVTAENLMLMLSGIQQAAASPDKPAAEFDPGASTAPVAAPVISHRAAQAMIEVLEAQEFNDKIPAGLPPGTPVAHKTGDIIAMHHDAAIVFPPGEAPYVLVVLTEGFVKEEDANRLIANVSRLVWDARHAPAVPEKPRRGHVRD